MNPLDRQDLEFYSLYTNGQELRAVAITRLAYKLLAYDEGSTKNRRTTDGKFYIDIYQPSGAWRDTHEVTEAEYNEEPNLDISWKPRRPTWLAEQWEYYGVCLAVDAVQSWPQSFQGQDVHQLTEE